MKKKKTKKKSRTKTKIIAISTLVLLISIIGYQLISNWNDDDAATTTRSVEDDVTIPNDDVTIPKDDITIPKDDVTIPKDDVTFSKDDITISNDDLTKPVNDITNDEIENGNDVIIDEEMLELFKSFDINSDGVIDPHEFPSVFFTIEELQQQGKSSGRQYDDMINNDVIDEDATTSPPHMIEYDEILQLSAQMKKFDVSTMKYSAKKNADLSKLREFRGLLSWQTVAEANIELAAERFAVFLPRNLNSFSTPYWLFTAPSPPDVTSQHHLRPPASWNNDRTVELVSRILSMFHPRPFVHMRFSPRGGAAVVSARNEQYLKIIFRLHCEFQLNEEEETPFWFTPGQFIGELIITKDGSHVHYFNIHVPNHRKLNVDMEWWVSPQEDDDVTHVNDDDVTHVNDDDVTEDMEVDIGYLPLMKIESQTPSSPNELVDEDGSIIDRRKLREMGEDVELHFDDVTFHDDIGDEKALNILDKFFNPFKKVSYLNFTDAIQECSMKRDKLLHHVILWGSLDDQSC